MQDKHYTLDELRTMAVAEIAKITGAKLDGFWVVTSHPNPAALVMHYTLPNGFKNSASVRL